ncbi:MAG TPA: 2,3-diphosphoglycerate synthetase [Actinomycetota bacterium]|nr:2,3-diphosphoglycerate synthetase [Actinomycetota bacterium]
MASEDSLFISGASNESTRRPSATIVPAGAYHNLSVREVQIRYLAVIDGEHYPPVIETALEEIARPDATVVAAVLAGGREKLAESSLEQLGDVPVLSGSDPLTVLDRALAELKPDEVIDLSDEPVLDYRRRHHFAAVTLAHRIPYGGADFRFEPPARPLLCGKPSLAMIGTGKRSGKTAVAGYAARVLKEEGSSPVVVAMGRGGPPEPVLLRGDALELSATELVAMADEGRHAASDYVEDALLARVPTVGCRRCGGGLAGGVEHSNVAEGIDLANSIDGDLLILEGSGSAIPPAHTDATILVVGAGLPPEYLSGYFGLYRLLLADLVVITMCEDPFASHSQISELVSVIRQAFRSSHIGGSKGEAAAQGKKKVEVVRTVFRPHPTKEIEGKTAFVATTAPEAASDLMKRHLEGKYGCRIAGISHALSDRRRLQADLEHLDRDVDVLLCEIKAAGIDMAARFALKKGLEVVFMDNVPEPLDGDDIAAAVHAAADLAKARFAENSDG